MQTECDIVILSHAKDRYLKKLTENALRSLFKSETEIDFKVIVVESNSHVTYSGCETIHPNEPFHYNKFLNLGIKKSKSDFVTMCNNDLIFEKGWFSAHLKAFNENPNLMSLSPVSPRHTSHKDKIGLHFGYQLANIFAGWCFTFRAETIRAIGGELPTISRYWKSDDIVAGTLQKLNLLHALNGDSVVIHIGYQTAGRLNEAEYHELKDQSELIYFQNLKKTEPKKYETWCNWLKKTNPQQYKEHKKGIVKIL